MTKKSEAPPIYVQRKGVYLAPEMQIDAEAISQLPYGERIKVTLHTGRSPRRLRFYWSFLQKVVASTEAAPNAEALHETIKLLTGYTTPVLVKGMTVMVPRSIAFQSMSEADFQAFLEGAIRFVAENYGISPEDVFGSERME